MNTANENYLVIKYHPEQWKAEFTVYREGKEHKDSDKLNTCYGSDFFLQKQGKKFFDDIANPFSGYPSIAINAVMTKEDFEDFKKMVESYNKEAEGTKFNCNLSQQLPGMGEIAKSIQEYGNNVANILEDYSGKFRVLNKNINNINKETNPVDKIINNLKEYRAKIGEFQKNFEDTNVNICFVGVYSSGKSTLINAILGHSTLPASIDPETAWRCCIKSPNKGEKVRVEFRLNDIKDDIVIEWDESNLKFVIKNSVKNEILNSLQTKLKENTDKRQDQQLKGILEEIKKSSSALTDNSINVFYKVPLDDNSAKFTIYDTPGTDSDNEKHKEVLQDLLKDQTHSILIFVFDPQNRKGTGNRELLNYIHNNKKDVNLDRLIFVGNKADAIQNDDDYDKLKEIVNEGIGSEGNKIALKDHILIYTSAGLALNAIAEKNHEGKMPFKKIGFDKDDDYTYYLLSHCASEYETQRLNAQSKEAFDKAADKTQQMLVFSGVYTLEKEIANYGKRFAPAARAFEMLSEFDKISHGLDDMIKQFEASLDVSKNKTETDIETQIQELNAAIDKAYEKFKLDPNPDQNDALYREKKEAYMKIVKSLELDAEGITKFARSAFQKVETKLQENRKIKKSLRFSKAKQTLSKTINDYLYNGTPIIRNKKGNLVLEPGKVGQCKQRLLQRKEEFRKAIIQEIDSVEEAEEKIKKYLNEIDPNFDVHSRGKEIERGFEKTIQDNTHKILGLFEYINQKKFIDDIESFTLSEVEKFAQEILDAFIKKDNEMIADVEKVFTSHLKELSSSLKLLEQNKKAFKEAMDYLNMAQKNLKKCREDYAKATNHKEERI